MKKINLITISSSGHELDQFAALITDDGFLPEFAEKYIRETWAKDGLIYRDSPETLPPIGGIKQVERLDASAHYARYSLVTKEVFPHNGGEDAVIEIKTLNILN